MIQFPEVNLGGILPALILCIAGLVVMIACLFVKRGTVTTAAIISVIGVLMAGLANRPLRLLNETAFSGLISLDAYTWFFNLLILIATGLTVLASVRYLADDETGAYEYFVLLLFAAAGMMFMVSGNHLLTIFVGLETLSISIYVLAGILPQNPKSSEAALKYLLLGGFSSGIFLYGAALLYGSAGSAGLPELAKYLKAGSFGPMALAGMGLLAVGFGFKVAAVPFPHVDAGRVRGSSYSDYRLYVRRRQGGGIRRICQGLLRLTGRASSELDSDSLGARGTDDDSG